jgi:hypothetical protein
MTLLELHQYIAQHLNSYGEGFIGEDELPEDFEIVEDDDWTQDHKYQHCTQIFKDGEGNFFSVTNSRSGSYHTDWYYQEPHVEQVKRVEKVVTKTVVSWEAV